MTDIQASQAADLRTAIATAPTALLTDTMLRVGLRGWMDDVLPVRKDSRIIGRARTARFTAVRGAERPNMSIYQFIRSLEPGDVLVIAAGGATDNLLGDNIAGCADLHGLAGIVTDGKNRDNAEIELMRMPLFSRGPGVRPPVHVELTDFDVLVECGGAQVRPGDTILGDRDGVVVLPAASSAAILAELPAVQALEAELAAAVAAQAPLETFADILARKKRASR